MVLTDDQKALQASARRFVREMPFVPSYGMKNALTPLAPCSGVPVRAKMREASARSANVIEVFSPLMM